MIEIRPYKEGDEKEIIKLFKACFGKEMSRKEWQWKYKKSPWGSVSYVVFDNKKLVSHYGGIKYLFYSGNKMLSAYQTCDVMTHPDYRGKFFGKKPLVVKAGEMFYMDNVMDFAFGFPSERHARLQRLLLDGSKYLKILLYKKDLSGANEIRNKSYKLETGWDIVNSDDLDNLWQYSVNNHPLSIVKDSKYLFWRYLEHPSKYYTLLAVKETSGSRIKAFAVTRCTGNELNIYEFCPGDPDLFNSIASYAKDIQAKVINISANENEEISHYLSSAGYKTTEYVPLSVRIIKKRMLTIKAFFQNYCYRLGDYDDA
jgi:hypothetical protein